MTQLAWLAWHLSICPYLIEHFVKYFQSVPIRIIIVSGTPELGVVSEWY